MGGEKSIVPERMEIELNKEVRDFYNNYDLSVIDHEKINDSYINNLIKERLGVKKSKDGNGKGFSDKWFAEFSVLATTIDPHRHSTLRCFSFIQDNGEKGADGKTFKDKIETYVSPIIGALKEKDKNEDWWFHNPETFLAPLQINPHISFTNKLMMTDDTLVTEYMKKNNNKSNSYKDGGDGFYFSSMEYSRTFSDILNFSKILYNNKKSISIDDNDLEANLVKHYHYGVEEARSYYDHFIAEDKEIYCYLTFPIVASHARYIEPEIYSKTYGDNFLKKRYQGLGHCFIYFNIKNPSVLESNSEIDKLKEQIRFLFQDINIALHNFAFNYTFNIGLLLQEKTREEATKSAKAAIMSRNMSHNLGSHVMSYLKQHLGSVKDIIFDGILADLVVGEAGLKSTLNHTTENTTLPFLMGVGHFVSYLQERQDFIATIATDYIPYFATVNFKDDIYDELNPDKRAERHLERKNGKTDNILLGNIARSEGLGRNTQPTELEKENNRGQLNDIVLKFRSHFNGNPVDKFDPEDEQKVAESSGYALQAEENRKKAEEELEQMREYDLSLPGGITGRQAVFSIIENVIRNAAKHGRRQGKSKLELTFDIFTNKDYDRERIPDNDNIDGCLSLRGVLENFHFQASDADDMFFMTITDNCDFSPLALYKLQQGLKEQYIEDETGKMKDGNKGLKEMRISAAWLRSIHNEEECLLPQPMTSIESSNKLTDEEMESMAKDGNWPLPKDVQKKKAPIIYARICDPKDDFGFSIETSPHLQYIICLNIPKRVALVSPCFETGKNDFLGTIEVEDIRRRLIKNRWRAYTCEEFQQEKNKSFEFILCDDAEDKTIFDKIRPIATARTYCFSKIERIKTQEGRQAFYKDLKKDDFFKKEKKENLEYASECDKFMMQLYKMLADYKGEEIITVDNKDSKNHLATDCDKVQSVDSEIDKYSNYIYRRHHESEIEFNEFMGNHLATNYVEGITGSNSSDRLVCHEKLGEMWFYRHLHAMKQQVAIFDERLFSKITRLEESSFVETDDVEAKSYSALAAIQRGIRCYTFIKDPKNERTFRLMGVSYNNGSPQYDSSYRCKCTRIATLSFSHELIVRDGKTRKKGLEVNYSSNINPADYEHLFDFITIHQGLLDKLYEAFAIKGSPNEKDDKELLTNGLFFKFSKFYDKVIDIKDDTKDRLFLPGMIIHSGRSKPSNDDMPQRLPFIQYAALEHAVLDCKFSLIELLDYARYE